MAEFSINREDSAGKNIPDSVAQKKASITKLVEKLQAKLLLTEAEAKEIMQ